MPAVRLDIARPVLDWAVERSNRDVGNLTERFPRFLAWQAGDAQPTLKQVEALAAYLHAPVGYLLLDAPPDEQLPIPDFRTVADVPIRRPSPELLDTIVQCEVRQDWYRTYAGGNDLDRLPFVGSATTDSNPLETAARVREALRFTMAERHRVASWTAAVAGLAEALETNGVLVMISGIVGSNATRPLDPDEFRGFTLADDLAPLIFVNGADTKAAQIFTICHESAHVWLNQSGISSASPDQRAQAVVERWCNAVAAEVLVPLDDISVAYNPRAELTDELDRLARRYRSSTLVVLRRIYDADRINWDAFRAAYDAEKQRVAQFGRPGSEGGGDFYRTLNVRASKRFVRALVRDTLAGQTLYRDAYRMLGIRSQATLVELGRRIGVA